MAFTSITFLFKFLPIVILIYSILNILTKNNKIKNIYIFIVSIIFYSFGNVNQLILLVLIIIMDYILGLALQKNRGNKKGKILLFFGIVINLSVLCLYKYSNFFIENINTIMSKLGTEVAFNTYKLSIPLGLSFYIFQSISYLVDIYRKNAKAQRNIIGIGLYISFFANITSGPIVKYEDFQEQLLTRSSKIDDIYLYMERFIIGFGKKVILAIPLGIYADKIFAVAPAKQATLVSWLGILLYTLQIYIDFSSYSDMAISLGGIFGFKIKENFNYPYMATSIQDFWRRWHMSLSTWFKEYLYIPLGGNRKGVLGTCRNTMIVFTLCGFWHGANWTFIIWGIYYGVILTLEKVLLKKVFQKMYKPFRHIYTIIVVMVGWVFFRSNSLNYAIGFLKSMIGIGNSAATIVLGDIINLEIIAIIALSLLLITPLLKNLFNKIQVNVHLTLILRYSLILLILITSFLWLSPTVKGALDVPFIYTKF